MISENSIYNRMAPSLSIRGVAHPPPPRSGVRANRADLTRAEIACTNLAGKPLLCEHDSGERVGTVLASWKGRDGSLRIAANVEQEHAIAQVKRGHMRGLSLGTSMILGEDGNVALRGQDELSICEEGKRPGTWCALFYTDTYCLPFLTHTAYIFGVLCALRIDTMNGTPCHAVECFSKSAAGAQINNRRAKIIWHHCALFIILSPS